MTFSFFLIEHYDANVMRRIDLVDVLADSG